MIGNQPINIIPPLPTTKSNLSDEDPRKRTGTFWTASARIITAVIGSGVLSLAWAMAQLGWIGGPLVMVLFAVVSYITSTLLAACYRCENLVNGGRNYTYMDAVKNIIGGVEVKLCGLLQYLNLFGMAVGYTIVAAVSMLAVRKSDCSRKSGGPCPLKINPYVIAFGVIQIIISQIPDFDKIWWISIIAAAMSFLYSSICIGLGISYVAANGYSKGSLRGISIKGMTKSEKICRIMEAIGEITFAFSFSSTFFEIQDTVKSPPSEENTMRKASLVSVGVTTTIFMLCGCLGYAAFGDMTPNDLLSGFRSYNPYWLLDVANVAVVVHLLRAYQLSCRPIFAFIEKEALARFSSSDFIAKDIRIRIPGFNPTSVNRFRLVSRTALVLTTTLMSMLFPFFNDMVGLFGALGFWPLTVYFPVKMYIKQKKISKWSKMWVCLHFFSFTCLVVSIAGAAGSVAGFVFDLKPYKLFEVDF